MKAVVTGASGLIGANLLRVLVEDRVDATALIRPSSDVSQIEGLPVSLAYGDVLEPESLAAAFIGAEAVFHTAVPFSYWGHEAGALRRTAVEGSRNILVAAAEAGVRRVVMTSSSVVLGASPRPEMRDEDASAEADAGESDYVLAKIEQEREALHLARRLGVDIVFALPTITVGPFGVTLGPSNGVLTSYLADPFHLTWRGGCNVVSARDVALGHLLLARHGRSGERYVLGSENLTWPQLHALIGELAGVGPPRRVAGATTCLTIAVAEEARARVTRTPPLATRAQARMVGRFYWYSYARAGLLGYAPQPAREALAEALAWLTAGPHVSREIRAGMRLARDVHDARRRRQRREASLAVVA